MINIIDGDILNTTEDILKCGIYKIENLKKQKIYVGKSTNILKRFRTHKYFLKNNKHYNKELQQDWNVFKENDFIFETIQTYNREELSEKETYWIEKLDTFNNGYNKTLGGNGGYSKYEQSVINNIATLYSNKYSIPEVSKILKIPQATIKDIVCLSNISRSFKEAKKVHYEKNTIFTDELINIITLLYKNGEDCVSIAEMFNTNRTSIADYLNANGVELRNNIERMRNRYNVKFSDEEILKLLENNTYEEVHNITTLSKSTLLNIKKRNNKQINIRREITIEEKNNILIDFNNCLSGTKISKKYKRRLITIQKVIKEMLEVQND